ncbi:MAG: hypothetical protein EHM34_03470 [Nitrosopumilales archaeon]|nr:MAG: hypothetical protein EHM34_03470 [Nitrosopumilales archaeon]
MAAPQGHKPYTGCEKGALFGFLGKGEDYYTDEELHELGNGVIDWIKQSNNIWLKYYFLEKNMLWASVQNLMKRSEQFKKCIEIAKNIQEAKLLTEPYYKLTDGYHARWMLARHHKGEWEEKTIVTADDAQKSNLEGTMNALDYLQSKIDKPE